MTVAELIAALREMPQDLPVLLWDSDFDYCPIEGVKPDEWKSLGKFVEIQIDKP